MVYERVRGWTSGRSLPVQNFVKYPTLGGRGGSIFKLTAGSFAVQHRGLFAHRNYLPSNLGMILNEY